MQIAPNQLQRDYESLIIYSFLGPNYPKVAARFKEFDEPVFAFNNLRDLIDEITYKKIYDWDGEGIISGTREKDSSGWRKFSPLDVAKLFIIKDLRAIGVGLEEIKMLLKKLKPYTLKTDKETIAFPQLPFFFRCAMQGSAVILLIDENKTPYFFPERFAIEKQFSYNYDKPIIILPFYHYVSCMIGHKKLEFIRSNETSIKPLLDANVTASELEIIKLIQNDQFEEITLQKHGKGEKDVHIKAKSTRRGNFSNDDIIKAMHENAYQKVTLSNKDGKTVTIEQERSIRT